MCPWMSFLRGSRSAESRYSVAIDADISEPSYRQTKTHAIIPPVRHPARKHHPGQARDFRFENGSTTDDHLMHILAQRKLGDQEWYLVKDSWRTAFDVQPDGISSFTNRMSAQSPGLPGSPGRRSVIVDAWRRSNDQFGRTEEHAARQQASRRAAPGAQRHNTPRFARSSEACSAHHNKRTRHVRILPDELYYLAVRSISTAAMSTSAVFHHPPCSQSCSVR